MTQRRKARLADARKRPVQLRRALAQQALWLQIQGPSVIPSRPDAFEPPKHPAPSIAVIGDKPLTDRYRIGEIVRANP